MPLCLEFYSPWSSTMYYLAGSQDLRQYPVRRYLEQYWSFTRGTRWSSKFKPISHPVPGLHKKLWAEVCIYLVSKLSKLCYTADPCLNPGGARNDYTNRSFFLTSFRFSNFKRICRVANNAVAISQMVKAIKIKLLNLGHLHGKVHARAQRRGTNLS